MEKAAAETETEPEEESESEEDNKRWWKYRARPAQHFEAALDIVHIVMGLGSVQQ